MTELQWYDVAKPLSKHCTFNIIIGGRGIGKTYSALDYVYKNNLKFLFVKRHKSDLEIVATELGNPFKTLNRDKGYNVMATYSDKIGFGSFYEDDKLLGYSIALTAGARGIDLSEIEVIIWDEFIPEEHKPYLKNEGIVFKNFYETVNRNRELLGQPPVIALLMSNSTLLDSPVLKELGLIPTVEHMLRTKQQAHTDHERSLHLVVLGKHSIGQAKLNTALYKLSGTDEFVEHAINNKFINDDMENITRVDLKEYVPFMRVCFVYFYEHKSNGNLYASRSIANCAIEYDIPTLDKFRLEYGLRLKKANVCGLIKYSSYDVKLEVINFLTA